MIKDIDTLVRHAEIAFESYQHVSGHDKKLFLYAIAQKLEDLGDKLIETCMSETHLPYNRFVGERARTCMQLRMFGDLVGEGSWVDAVIEIGDPLRKPIPKPDMRKMLTPIGPVVVFGASNFPLAYATPGGDTASALAAGCTVIVRGHPQHPKTSEMCAQAIIEAAKETHMPKYVFQHINVPEHEVGKRLVMHSGIKSVGFTGSLQGGRALLQYAHQRQEPIPVFAEMGSINPVLLLRNKLREDTPFIAQQLA